MTRREEDNAAVKGEKQKRSRRLIRRGDGLRRWLTDAGGHHSLVVVGVDTHVVTLEVKGKLAAFDVLQLVLVQVGPAPQPCVDDVGEAFPPRYL